MTFVSFQIVYILAIFICWKLYYSETQFQVGEKFNFIIWRIKGKYLKYN